MRIPIIMVLLSYALGGCATSPSKTGSENLHQQVLATETAFAATMANRDFEAFSRFISDEAVFFDGNDPLRGREAVLATWRAYFEGPDAPFSWQPDQVEVLDSGVLALSTGPVFTRDGRTFARFQSIWRRDENGAWHIVFDKGYRVCP